MRKDNLLISEDGVVASIFLHIHFLRTDFLAVLTVGQFAFCNVTRNNDSDSIEVRNDQKLGFLGSRSMFNIRLL